MCAAARIGFADSPERLPDVGFAEFLCIQPSGVRKVVYDYFGNGKLL